MSRVRRATIAAVVIGGFAAAANVVTAANAGAHWVLDPRTGCYVYDPDVLPADTAAWSGDCANRRATGTGAVVFTAGDRFAASVSGTFASGLANGAVRIGWADGAHFEGHAVLGRIAGDGTLTAASGDRLEGTWKGSRDGEGTIAWPNGDYYQGPWADGLPSGNGVLIRKDGSRFEGKFIAGEPQLPAAMATASTLSASAASAPAAPKSTGSTQGAPAPVAVVSTASDAAQNGAPRWLDGIDGHKFVSADGSVLFLSRAEQGWSRQISHPEGATSRVYLRFLNGSQGTVGRSPDAKAIDGVFHLNDSSLAVDYADGRAESLSTYSANALLASLTGPGQEPLCTVWYPEGHQFSGSERQAALEEYARRLGVSKTPSQSCAAATQTESASVTKPSPAISRSVRSEHKHADNHTVLPVLADAATREPILVRASDVHPIDPTVAEGAAPLANDPSLWHSGPQPNEKGGATVCLSIGKENGNLGFRNSCDYDVQFAYCAASVPEKPCDDDAAVSGAAANAFAPVTADAAFGEREFHFRWIECAGKSGEVTARLLHSVPPEGRCTKTQPDGPILALKAPDPGTALTLPR